MRFGATVVLASALLVSLAAQAQAQPGGGRGGPGGRGGFGFGGPGGGGAAGLLMMEEVRKEVGISEEQFGKIREAMQELGGGRGPGGPGGGNRVNPQDLSEEERAKLREEFQKQMEERAKKSEEILKSNLDAKQLARLEELRIQREGAGALARTEVAAKLKLSDEQKEKIKEALASGQMDFRGGRGPGGPGGGGFDREAFQKQMEEARAKREKANADALAVLTADQKTAFEGLQGAKFEFPAFGGFGGRGPGGPGGGRPGRPPAGND